MITKQEINRRASQEGLRFDQIEKDYAILWILSAFSQPQLNPYRWVLKGGTCLRHCYYPGYRFSEDLDFTCPPGNQSPHSTQELLHRLAAWVQDAAEITMSVKELRTIPSEMQVEIPVEYSRGGSRRKGLPSVKLHLTFDEPILAEAFLRPVNPPYSDLAPFHTLAYSKYEIAAEKMRALIQQQQKWPRPRDLYDLWFMLCHSGDTFDSHRLTLPFTRNR